MAEEQNDSSCVGGCFFSFLAGVLIGGALGLLFAPVAGNEAREAIGSKYDELKKKVKTLEEKFLKHEG